MSFQYLLYLNGRLGSDRGIGAFTRIDTTGTSVVDYIIGSPQLFAVTSNFYIHGKFTESDHVPLSISVNSKRCQNKYCDKTAYADTWTKHCKYKRSLSDIEEFKRALIDDKSYLSRNSVLEAFIYMRTSNEIAVYLTEYITQAADRAFEIQVAKPSITKKSPGWYDKKCRQLRGEAVTAGERATSGDDVRDLLQKYRAYKACKQRKTRQYKRNAILEIEYT